ncbi:MAG: N-acetylmuramoyl-L-alanine amidase [Armatimonadetes bacterium]|nr:N-acetylmuramoyl-L-alanine amidase [Armatimonadota bacterium]
MTARRNSDNARGSNKTTYSTLSIIIGALFGALLGMGVWIIATYSSSHRVQPDIASVPPCADVSTAIQPQVTTKPTASVKPNQQPSQSKSTAGAASSQLIGPVPTPKRSLVICVDPGHPSEVSSGKTVQNGLQEVVINWNVAAYLIQNLQASGYSVICTKTHCEETVTNKRRAEIANQNGASLLIRLHCDTGSGSGYTLYYPDRQGKKNEKVGPSALVIKSSYVAADAIHRGMTAAMKGDLKDNGVKGDSATKIGGRQGALTGAIYSDVPAVTVEMVFLSNRADADFIRAETGQQRMASALAAGIAQ